MAIFFYFTIIIIALLLLISDKKRLLYYFVFLYPILPEYLSISISESLPLITASRILLFIMFLGTLSKGKIRVNVFRTQYFGKAFVFFLFIHTIWLLAHVTEIDSIKTFIGIALENYLLVVIVFNFINGEKEIYKCLHVLLASATFVFVMGILEPITKVNFSSLLLDTGSRDTILSSSYSRYNSIRAVFSFGHSIALGVFCVGLLPLVMYLSNNEKRIKYSIVYLLGVGCILMTMSRGIIVVFGLMFAIQLLGLNKKQRKGYLRIILAAVISMLLGIFLIPNVYQIARDTVLGTLNAFGAHFTTGSAGENENALLSRFSQLSMIGQVFYKYPIWGGGTGYIRKNSVFVYLTDRSFQAYSVDIDYLLLLIERGIMGLLSTILLYCSLLKLTVYNFKKQGDVLSKYFFYSFASIFLSYFTVAQLTTGRILWLLIALYICYCKQMNDEQNYIIHLRS